MSLLMKALKEAEHRHQQASAALFDQPADVATGEPAATRGDDAGDAQPGSTPDQPRGPQQPSVPGPRDFDWPSLDLATEAPAPAPEPRPPISRRPTLAMDDLLSLEPDLPASAPAASYTGGDPARADSRPAAGSANEAIAAGLAIADHQARAEPDAGRAGAATFEQPAVQAAPAAAGAADMSTDSTAAAITDRPAGARRSRAHARRLAGLAVGAVIAAAIAGWLHHQLDVGAASAGRLLPRGGHAPVEPTPAPTTGSAPGPADEPAPGVAAERPQAGGNTEPISPGVSGARQAPAAGTAALAASAATPAVPPVMPAAAPPATLAAAPPTAPAAAPPASRAPPATPAPARPTAAPAAPAPGRESPPSATQAPSSPVTPPGAPPAAARPPASARVPARPDDGSPGALERGYDALRAGRLDAARALYQQVLATDPLNVDAHLGLATLEARDGRAQLAERHFLQVLASDPSHRLARTGLASLRAAGDPVAQESQIRLALAEDDHEPSLHFALGNVLAAQGRWPEAQQAYFAASSGDPDQPDYVYNLAISLERLRQPAAALAQYHRALELAQQRPATFPRERALARVAALGATGDLR